MNVQQSSKMEFLRSDKIYLTRSGQIPFHPVPRDLVPPSVSIPSRVNSKEEITSISALEKGFSFKPSSVESSYTDDAIKARCKVFYLLKGYVTTAAIQACMGPHAVNIPSCVTHLENLSINWMKEWTRELVGFTNDLQSNSWVAKLAGGAVEIFDCEVVSHNLRCSIQYCSISIPNETDADRDARRNLLCRYRYACRDFVKRMVERFDEAISDAHELATSIEPSEAAYGNPVYLSALAKWRESWLQTEEFDVVYHVGDATPMRKFYWELYQDNPLEFFVSCWSKFMTEARVQSWLMSFSKEIDLKMTVRKENTKFWRMITRVFINTLHSGWKYNLFRQRETGFLTKRCYDTRVPFKLVCDPKLPFEAFRQAFTFTMDTSAHPTFEDIMVPCSDTHPTTRRKRNATDADLD